MTDKTDLAALAHAEDDHTPSAATSIPDEIKAMVDRAHKKWELDPWGWQKVKLSGEEAVNEIHKLAARYAKETGRTFRRDRKAAADHLRFKVTDAVKKNTQ